MLIDYINMMEKPEKNSVYDAVELLEENEFHNYSCDIILWEEPILEASNYEWNSGATKVVILFKDFVLKKSISGEVIDTDKEGFFLEEPEFFDSEEDHCQVEYRLYELAKEAGCAQFFAETDYLENGVYIQEKSEKEFKFDKINAVLTDGDYNAVKMYYKANNLENITNKITNKYIVSALLRDYSIEELKVFGDFINFYDINDIHSNNVGIFNGRIKLFDFSGYASRTSEILVTK